MAVHIDIRTAEVCAFERGYLAIEKFGFVGMNNENKSSIKANSIIFKRDTN